MVVIGADTIISVLKRAPLRMLAGIGVCLEHQLCLYATLHLDRERAPGLG